jgi:hypothetical protein
MPLESVFSILSFSDSFWKKATLNVLRMLMSTSKGFHKELTNNNTSSSSTTKNIAEEEEHAPLLLSMIIRARPHALNGWVLKFSDAKYRFSLHPDVMAMHCAALPVENRCHFYTPYSSEREVYMKIPFIDAYKLAVAGGLKSAMERRHQYDIELEESINKLVVEKFGRGLLFTVMESNIDDGIRRLHNELPLMVWDHNDETRMREKRLKIHSLERLNNDIHDIFYCLLCLLPIDNKKKNKRNPFEAEAAVRNLNNRAMNIVACYRDRSVFCPEAMPVDFLSGI